MSSESLDRLLERPWIDLLVNGLTRVAVLVRQLELTHGILTWTIKHRRSSNMGVEVKYALEKLLPSGCSTVLSWPI